MNDVHLRRGSLDVRSEFHWIEFVGHELVGSCDQDQMRVVVVQEHVRPVQFLFEYIH
jgi:hypothetical protein